MSGPGGPRVARDVVVIALFAAVAAVARVAQDIAIAGRHGAGATADAYYLVLGLVSWPAAFALSTLTLLLVPAEAARQRTQPAPALRAWRAGWLGRTLLAALLAWPLVALPAAALLQGGLTRLDAAGTAIALAALPWLSAVLPLGVLGALFTAWLVAAGRRAVTLLEALPALTLTLLLLAGGGAVLFWGTAAGFALQVAAMAWWLHRAGALPAPRLAMPAAPDDGARRGLAALVLAQLLFAPLPMVDPLFAAGLGEGAIGTLSYASRLTLGITGLAGLALQRAVLPPLARAAALGAADAGRLARRWALRAAAAGAVLALAGAVLADPLVGLLFERGRFGAAERQSVAALLQWGMLQLPPFMAGVALATALASARGGWPLAAVAAIGLAVKLGLNALLVQPLGATGLMIATAGMYAATALAGWVALPKPAARPAGA